RGNTKWNQFIPYTLADVDIVVIDASSADPTVSDEVRGVGTNIGNAVFDATANRLYVANTESFNQIRFEPKLRGHFLSNRVSIINFAGAGKIAATVDINPDINLDEPDGSDQERASGLALPADIARGADGTLYVAATGSARVGVLDSGGAVQARINTGRGPTG